jgi:hypothetical protein
MPYIDTMFKEGTVVQDLKNLLVTNGWTFEKSFIKVSYPGSMVNPESLPDPDAQIISGIAKHQIFKNAEGLYYGVAKIFHFTDAYKNYTPTKPYTTPANEDALIAWLGAKYEDFTKEAILYFYMIEKLPDVTEGEIFGHGYNLGTVERNCVDVETKETAYVRDGNGYYQFTYTVFDADVQQSPFIKSTLRNPNLTLTDIATNWWPDSSIRVKGFVDASTLFVIVQADNSPAFANNVVPSVPIYWGQFTSFKEGDTGNHALWAGTAFDTGAESQSHLFDYKSTTPYRKVSDFLPLQKTYPNFPGNGVDNVIVKRSELGSRYQAYYLSWNTAPQNMPPDRVGKDGGQYPMSWTTQDNDEYKYKFNPSMYSQKIHTSRAYLIHPDEGVRGYLPRMVILAPLGLVNEDKLKVRTGTCPDTFDIYRFFLTGAISPISKRPGTAYTPAGVGIFEKTV